MNKQCITLFLITFSLSIIAMNPDVVPESRVPHWVNAGEKLFEKAEDFLSQTQEERSQTLVEYTKIIKSTLPPTQGQEERPQVPTGCAKSVKSTSSPTPHQLIDQALEHINSLSQEGLLSNTIVWSYFGYLAELGSTKPLRLSVWSQQTTLYCLPWAAESAQRLEKSFLNNLTLNFSYSEEEDKSAEVEQLHAAFDEGTYKPLLLFSPNPQKAKLGILPLLRVYAKGGAPVVLTPYDPSIQVHAGRFVGVSEIMNHDISHFYAFELIFGKGRSLAKGAEALSGWLEKLTPAVLSQKNIQQALIGAFFFTHEGFLDDFSHFPSQYLPEKIIDDFLGKNGPKKCLEAHCEGLCLMYWAATTLPSKEYHKHQVQTNFLNRDIVLEIFSEALLPGKEIVCDVLEKESKKIQEIREQKKNGYFYFTSESSDEIELSAFVAASLSEAEKFVQERGKTAFYIEQDAEGDYDMKKLTLESSQVTASLFFSTRPHFKQQDFKKYVLDHVTLLHLCNALDRSVKEPSANTFRGAMEKVFDTFQRESCWLERMQEI